MGDKKFHSESSLQNFEADAVTNTPTEDHPKDPGVQNATINDLKYEDDVIRRRPHSQPGPVSGSFLTATAARAARKKNVNYAPPNETHSQPGLADSFLTAARAARKKNVNYAPPNPGPVSGSFLTAARAARKKNVNYAPPNETHSQPGPVSGSFLTATAARAARKKNVNYAPPNDFPKPLIPNGNGSGSGTVSPTGVRGSLPNNPNMMNGNFQRNADVKSLYSNSNYRMSPGTPPKRTGVFSLDAQSIRSVDTQAPPPTDPKDNVKQTRKYLTLVMSSIYAVLLVTLGLMIHIADTIIDPPISSIYSLILVSIGFLYHIYLIIDIARYKRTALRNQKIRSQYEEKVQEYFRIQEEEYGCENEIKDEQRSPADWYKATGIPPPVLAPLSHNYCFSQGRHSGSFYLKLGAAGFAMGNLVHSVLLIVVQVGYLLDENIDNNQCVEYTRGVAHFAFMHIIGSSLCFWISAIVRETVLSLAIYASYANENGYGDNGIETDNATTTTPIDETYTGTMSRIFEVDAFIDEECTGAPAFTSIFENFSPYLYPFSVEFNILIVAVYYIIWSNIGHCHNEESSASSYDGNQESFDEAYSICKIPTASEENDFTSNMVIYADCHASNKGMFLGLMIVVIIVGSLIIGFVFSSVGGEFLQTGYLVNNITKLGLHSIMLFAAILAFTQTTKLDINEHPISLLDDILLFICLPPFFMEAVFSLVATITILNVVNSIDFVVMVIQVLVQTPLIMDALRRCSNAKKLRRRKPARELIMFLLITNVGMWLFYTFSYKSPDSLDERYEFYGKVLWTILGHVSLPLIMFYRFHSSVCFADIWTSAYKPGSEH
ncbi:otopetrin domain-containing protein [Phthorimaea operculella]|nr:otopetrin domain-containing protein [Phthorimaea operculella]